MNPKLTMVYSLNALTFQFVLILSSTRAFHKIEVQPFLEIFQDCAIEVIQNVVHSSTEATSSQTTKLDMGPFETPIVASMYFYEMQPNGKLFCSKQAKTLRYSLTHPKTRHDIYQTSLRKPVCDISLYLVPFTCDLWDVDKRLFVGAEEEQVIQDAINGVLPNYKKQFNLQLRMTHERPRLFALLQRRDHFQHRKHRLNLLSTVWCYHLKQEVFAAPIVITWPIIWSSIEKEDSVLSGLHISPSPNENPFFLAEISSLQKTHWNLAVKCMLGKEGSALYDYVSRNWEHYNLCLDNVKRSAASWSLREISIKTLSRPSTIRASIEYTVVAYKVSSLNNNGLTPNKDSDTEFQKQLLRTILPNITLVPIMQVHAINFFYPLVFYYPFRSDPTSYIAIKRMSNVYFVSCHIQQEFRTFSISVLFSSFEFGTWMFLGICAGISGVTLCCYNPTRTKHCKHVRADIWERFTFPFYLLMSQESKALSICKPVALPWLLLGMVLTCTYQGDNIMEFTKPLQMKSFRKFSQILEANFTIFQPNIGTHSAKLLKKLEAIDNSSLNLPPQPQTLAYGMLFDAYNIEVLSVDGVDVDVSKRKTQLTKQLQYPGTMREMFKMSERNYFVARLKRCKSVAYIDTLENLLGFYNMLYRGGDLDSRFLYLSDESFEKVYTIARFQYFPYPLAQKIWKRLSELFQSGTRDRLELNRESVTGFQKSAYLEASAGLPQSVSLKGNISVVFLSLLKFFGIVVLVFIMENGCCLFYFFKSILKNWKTQFVLGIGRVKYCNLKHQICRHAKVSFLVKLWHALVNCCVTPK